MTPEQNALIEGIRFAAQYLMEQFNGKTGSAELFSMELDLLAEQVREALIEGSGGV